MAIDTNAVKCGKCEQIIETEAEQEETKATLCVACTATANLPPEDEKLEATKSEEVAPTPPTPPPPTTETRMDIDTDLTTTETMPTLEELDNPSKSSPALELQPEQPQSDVKQEQEDEQQHLASIALDEEDPALPVTPTPTARSGKITRSSLNGGSGSRTPTIMKRLRKSTRSTRFKSKLTGRSSLSGGSSNGQNGNQAGNSSFNSSSAANHHHHHGSLSNSGKSHGKSGSGASGAGGGLSGGSLVARNRRALFKRPAQKTPKVQASTRFVKSVFYKGSYMQIGDIVNIVDGQQNVFYAQIRGLLVDAYCEKSAFLTWLIPTQDSPDPKEGFDPATYLIGPDEELSRKLSYLEFVMHAPSNYYYDRTTPYPLPDVDEYTSQRSGGFIWTRLPIIKREKKMTTATTTTTTAAATNATTPTTLAANCS